MDPVIERRKKAQENVAMLNLFASKDKQKAAEPRTPATSAKKVTGSSVVTKDDNFTVFENAHADEAARIAKDLLDAPTVDDYIAMSSELRGEINERMYVYVVSVASSHRHDLKSTRIPPIYETTSRGFFRDKVLKELREKRQADAGITDGEEIVPEGGVPPQAGSGDQASKKRVVAPLPSSPGSGEPQDKKAKSGPQPGDVSTATEDTKPAADKTSTDDSKPTVDKTPTEDPKPADKTPIEDPKPTVKPEDSKPTVKPEDPKSTVKPEDSKPAVKPEDPKPAVKPEDSKPAVKPEDPKPTVKPEDAKPDVSIEDPPPAVVVSERTVEDMEQVVDYWREDVCLNSHHWHWHVVYPIGLDYLTDRRGELFFYMHRQMLARYDAERLSLGLSPVKPFDNWEDPIQGYDCELAGFGVRPPLLKVSDDEVQWLRYQKSQATELLKKPGLTIDEYGTWVERNLHNGGHVIISKMRKIVPGEMPPMVVPGVMLYVETAIRDPMFFRWHKYVDSVIEMYKQNVAEPYTDADLTWAGMEVEGIEILDNRHFVTNTLETFKRSREIDLSYSIDLRQEDYDGNKVTVTHLDHNKFSYRFRVKNSTGKARWATVRVFLVPVLDESGEPYTMKEYHSKCIEMDRFTQKIDTGSRIFERASSDSSVIIPWDQSFSVLYGNIEKEQDYVQQANEDYCGCGWPEHLQIPRGKVGGMPYRVLVMLTDWEDDKVKRDRTVPVNPDDTKVYIIADNEEHKSCKNAASYCGRRDLLYPDRRDMGFPFDRPLGPETLDSFIAGRRNFNYTNLTIRHTNKVLNE